MAVGAGEQEKPWTARFGALFCSCAGRPSAPRRTCENTSPGLQMRAWRQYAGDCARPAWPLPAGQVMNKWWRSWLDRRFFCTLPTRIGHFWRRTPYEKFHCIDGPQEAMDEGYWTWPCRAAPKAAVGLQRHREFVGVDTDGRRPKKSNWQRRCVSVHANISNSGFRNPGPLFISESKRLPYCEKPCHYCLE